MSQLSRPLLDNDDDGDHGGLDTVKLEGGSHGRCEKSGGAIPPLWVLGRQTWCILLAQLCLTALATIVVIRWGCWHDVKDQVDHIPSNQYAPAAAAIQYQQQYFSKNGHLTSPFSKAPGREVDEAWHELLQGMNIRVSGSYLSAHNTTSVRLADGSGYIGQMGVYHELHCLKKLKHSIHREHYFPDLSHSGSKEMMAHMEHCLEWLRVVALCRSDTTLSTFSWSSDTPPRLETQYPIPHRCVKSEKLLDWSRAHAVDISAVELEGRD